MHSRAVEVDCDQMVLVKQTKLERAVSLVIILTSQSQECSGYWEIRNVSNI